MSDRNYSRFLPAIVLGSIVGVIIILQIPIPESHENSIIDETSNYKLKEMDSERRFHTLTSFADTPDETFIDSHGEKFAEGVNEEHETSSGEYHNEGTTSIKVFIITNTGEKKSHNFQKIIQWTQQAYPNRLTPQLELDSIPGSDKEYLYNMVKQKFENNEHIDNVDILLEVISKDNTVIVRTYYTSCEIDQYWLVTDNKIQSPDVKSNNLDPHEQFFFKCKDYSVNPILS